MRSGQGCARLLHVVVLVTLVVLASCVGRARRGSTAAPRIEVVARDVTLGSEQARWVDAWVTMAEANVTALLGRFPVADLRLVLVPGTSPGISDGVASGGDDGVATIRVAVHPEAPREAFERDWVLTHEMLHLALPTLAPEHHWLEEGSATYLEPLARARRGVVDEDDVWRELLTDYAQGLPGPDDRGLDHDASWARTYYGGAIFCLLADVEIRARTDNRQSLVDVFRALVEAGIDGTQSAPIERVLAVGDSATGTTVLTELYARAATQPWPRELDSTWKRLGISVTNGQIVRDESAPLAHVRRGLVRGSP